VDAKTLLSAAAATFATWLLVARALEEYFGYEFQNMVLKVFAKCPGLPYGAYSGGPDYIDISIDIGLTVIAGMFIYLTVRDIRRKRKAGFVEDEEKSEDQEERDEL
jgi:hypothetical protein